MTFKDLNLSEPLLRALADKGYTEPTPIQAASIPPVLAGRDLMGLAQTGTGKTASFTLPMLDILNGGRAKARMPRALILTPTRELAVQIGDNLDAYSKYMKLTYCLIYGGVSLPEQQKQLMKGVDILIATPGRLLDIFERGGLLMMDMSMVVLDEADRMLDMGFMPDVEKILSLTPKRRQTMMFSATMPPAIKKIKDQFMNNPEVVQIEATSSAATTVEQNLVMCASNKAKDQKTLNLLNQKEVESAFVFCNRKRSIDPLAKFLKTKGVAAEGLHGDMNQSERIKTLDRFKAGEVMALICSDVVARGIDIKDVSHVINYDIPMNAEDYVHRIGRTGRAGSTGVAYSLATKLDDKFLDAIEELLGKKFSERKAGVLKDDNNKQSSSQPAQNKKPVHKNAKPKHNAQAKPKPNHDAKPKHSPKPSKSTQDDISEENNDGKKGFGDDVPDFLKGFG